jgi:hypothetical protein
MRGTPGGKSRRGRRTGAAGCASTAGRCRLFRIWHLVCFCHRVGMGVGRCLLSTNFVAVMMRCDPVRMRMELLRIGDHDGVVGWSARQLNSRSHSLHREGNKQKPENKCLEKAVHLPSKRPIGIQSAPENSLQPSIMGRSSGLRLDTENIFWFPRVAGIDNHLAIMPSLAHRTLPRAVQQTHGRA